MQAYACTAPVPCVGRPIERGIIDEFRSERNAGEKP